MHARAGRRRGFGDGQSEARRVKLRMTGVTCARVRASVLVSSYQRQVILTPRRDALTRNEHEQNASSVRLRGEESLSCNDNISLN